MDKLFDWIDKHYAKLYIIGIAFGLTVTGLVVWALIETIAFLKRH